MAWVPLGSIQGPPGPPGTGEGGGGYKHVQTAASTVWDIQHNLGYDPAGVRVVAANGDTWLPTAITYPTPGAIARITFPQSIAGNAWVS